MFSFEKKDQNQNNAVLIILLLLEIFWSLALLFITCELGERAGQRFNEIFHMVDQFNLYYFPNNMKKMLPIVMVMVQKPLRIAVFGSVTCGREAFKNVSLFVKLIYNADIQLIYHEYFSFRSLTLDFLILWF